MFIQRFHSGTFALFPGLNTLLTHDYWTREGFYNDNPYIHPSPCGFTQTNPSVLPDMRPLATLLILQCSTTAIIIP